MYQVRIDAATGIAVLDFSGEVSFSEFAICFEELAAHPDFRAGLTGVADLRDAEMTMDDMDAERLGHYVVAGGTRLGRWALLVDQPLETALTILYEQVVLQLHPVEVFSSVEGASTFLEQDLGPLLRA